MVVPYCAGMILCSMLYENLLVRKAAIPTLPPVNMDVKISMFMWIVVVRCWDEWKIFKFRACSSGCHHYLEMDTFYQRDGREHESIGRKTCLCRYCFDL